MTSGFLRAAISLSYALGIRLGDFGGASATTTNSNGPGCVGKLTARSVKAKGLEDSRPLVLGRKSDSVDQQRAEQAEVVCKMAWSEKSLLNGLARFEPHLASEPRVQQQLHYPISTLLDA